MPFIELVVGIII